MFAFILPAHSLFSVVRSARLPAFRSSRRPNRTYSSPIKACSSVTRETVEKTAHLAQLQLSEHEISQITPDFQNIIALIDRMSEWDVEGIEPMARPHNAQNVLREDKPVMFPNVYVVSYTR